MIPVKSEMCFRVSACVCEFSVCIFTNSGTLLLNISCIFTVICYSEHNRQISRMKMCFVGDQLAVLCEYSSLL